MIDIEAVVFETIAEHTGVDPAELSLRTKLRGSRDIHAAELLEIRTDIEAALSLKIVDSTFAGLKTIEDLMQCLEQAVESR